MQINATNNSAPLPGPERRVAAPAMDRQDAAVFAESDALALKLSQVPTARAEAVARARALIVQAEYPPDLTIRGIANLIATNLYSDEE
jgi:hypothetical protein